jgi:hypothetical protein
MAQGKTETKEETAPAKEQVIQAQPAKPAEQKAPPQNEYVKMTDGKIWHYVSGKQTEVSKEAEVTLGGTKVKGDGTVTMQDGTTAKMKEGNIVNINGKLIDFAALRQKAEMQKATQQQKAVEPKPAETAPKGE